MITMALVEPDNQPDVRCTEAVLNAFGIYGIAPRDGGGVLEALVAHGYGYAQVDFEFGQTLQSFVAQYPQGDYYMFSSGHAMALRDGVLTDTEDKGPNRRRLQGAYRIRKRIEASLRMNAQYATMSAQDFMQKFKVGWTLSGPNPTWELVQRELQDDYVVKAIVEDLRNGVGIQSPVVVEGATQTVIDGHHRVIACLLTNIPVPYVVQPTYKLVDGKMVAVGVQKQAFDEWQDENCGLYAQALMQLKPGLRLGIIGGGEHMFAHDDHYAYDSLGRHPLPYEWPKAQDGTNELDADPDDWFYGELHAPPADRAKFQAIIERAKQHAIANHILS